MSRRREKGGKPKRAQSDAYLLKRSGKGSFTARYVDAIRQGLNKTHAAVAGGCSPSTVREWETRAVEDLDAGLDTVFTRFDSAVGEARAQLAAECMETINTAIEKGDWRAARWVLERSGYRVPKHDHSVEVKTGFYYMDEQDREA